jgi:TetR/AcrR family transcriptional regulator, regulator of biofilm formation and stress response
VASARPGYGEGREALLAAAVEVVGDKGLRGLTYREVARVAGVTHGLVAHHFGSRQALIKATLDYAVGLGSRTIHFADDNVEDFAADLSRLIRETAGLQAFQFELLLEARRDQTLSDSAKFMYDEYIGLIQSDLARLGLSDQPALARFLMAAVDGLVIQQLVYDNAEDTDEAVALLQRVLKDLAVAGARR